MKTFKQFLTEAKENKVDMKKIISKIQNKYKFDENFIRMVPCEDEDSIYFAFNVYDKRLSNYDKFDINDKKMLKFLDDNKINSSKMKPYLNNYMMTTQYNIKDLKTLKVSISREFAEKLEKEYGRRNTNKIKYVYHDIDNIADAIKNGLALHINDEEINVPSSQLVIYPNDIKNHGFTVKCKYLENFL